MLTIELDKLPAEDRERVLKAVDRLCKNNPDAVKELEGLADLKEKNPAKWLMGKKLLKL